MKVLLSVRGLRRREGGPTYTVPGLASALSRRGHDVRILVDAFDIPECAEYSIVKRRDLTVPLSKFVREFDIVHDNGTWLPFNHAVANACRKAGVPRVVSPRGSLQPWVMKQHRLKKLLGWFFYQETDLKNAQALITTAEIEAEQMRLLGYEGPIRVVPNGVDEPSCYSRKVTDPAAKKIALFLARIHPKKGLGDLIEAWTALKPTDWILYVAGPDDEGIARQLSRRVASVEDMRDAIRFLGPVYGEEREALYREASLYVLPTYSENFGVSVAEAMMMGTPVLTTTETPWDLLRTEGLGWICEPGAKSLREALKQPLSLDAKTLAAIGEKGREHIHGRYSWNAIAFIIEQVYLEVSNNLRQAITFPHQEFGSKEI
jgi:glycosyltransferase involved in cell wall biosynthesis